MQQQYSRLLVLDVEATCLKDMRINPQEIIEISCVAVDGKSFKVVDEFDRLVKPVHKPKLSPFCVRLTGIQQREVDEANTFPEVWKEFTDWFNFQIQEGQTCIFVACGDWDFKTMIPNQCNLSKIKAPEAVSHWINLKKVFEETFNKKISRLENDLTQMMNHFNLKIEGRLHRGIDDVRNMARLLAEICKVTQLNAPDGPANILMSIENKTPSATSSSNSSRHSVSPSPQPFQPILQFQPKAQRYDFFLVLDFEATCLKDMMIRPQEIIEFPCILVNAKTGEFQSTFHRYVKPAKKPKLSPFCIKLTKIKQNMVDNQPEFVPVFEEFKQWLTVNNVFNHKAIFVTCGDWDLKTMLPAQCKLSDIELPDYCKSWINAKKVFQEVTRIDLRKDDNDLMQMLKHLQIQHEGTLHSGIDDTKNLARILNTLMCYKELQPTTAFP